MNPKHPVYIPSKGRSDSRLTVKALDAMRVPYRVVVEPQEADAYARVIDRDKLLVMDDNDQGLHFARNWCWSHAESEGAERFWMIDDNVSRFFRVNYNLRVPVTSGTIFRCAEEFSDRFTNVAQTGFQYYTFMPRRGAYGKSPLILNTRIYSITMNLTSLPYRYRLFYNDDTDLSLQALKGGWCTVLFQAFLGHKHATMTVKGGLTELYTGTGQDYTGEGKSHELEEKEGPGGRLEMARQLVEAHPDCTRIVHKWGRYQHSVDYRPFRGNRLQYRPGFVPARGFDEHGMALEKKTETGWERVTEPPEWRRGE